MASMTEVQILIDAELVAEIDRLKDALQNIVDHHNVQMNVAWNDVSGDDMQRYHQERRNIALMALMPNGEVRGCLPDLEEKK